MLMWRVITNSFLIKLGTVGLPQMRKEVEIKKSKKGI
jgi:hypothetical protein